MHVIKVPSSQQLLIKLITYYCSFRDYLKQHLQFYIILALSLLHTHTPIVSHYLQEPLYLIIPVLLLTDNVYNQIPTADQ